MFRLVNCTKSIKNTPNRTILTSIPISRSGNYFIQTHIDEFLSQNMSAGNKFLIRGNRLQFRGNEFRTRGNEFPMRGNRFRLRGNEFWVRGNKFQIRGNEIPIRGNEFRINGNQFWNSGTGNQVSGIRFYYNQYQHIKKVSPITNLKN